METKRSTSNLLFYLKMNEPKKNGKMVILCRISIDGKPVQFSTKLEIASHIWGLKHSRIFGEHALVLSINQKFDAIQLRINHQYYEMLSDEGFATEQKVELAFLQ